MTQFAPFVIKSNLPYKLALIDGKLLTPNGVCIVSPSSEEELKRWGEFLKPLLVSGRVELVKNAEEMERLLRPQAEANLAEAARPPMVPDVVVLKNTTDETVNVLGRFIDPHSTSTFSNMTKRQATLLYSYLNALEDEAGLEVTFLTFRSSGETDVVRATPPAPPERTESGRLRYRQRRRPE